MSIKDLSDNVRIPRLGKFHLGIMVPNKGGQGEHPEKTDYFVVDETHPDKDKIIKLFGEKPKELRVQIPTENEEEWCPQYYRAYDMTHGLVCKGDGESALRMVDIKTNNLPTRETNTVKNIDVACKGKECLVYQAKKCSEVMNLRVVIPELPGLGIWQIDTGSINSILNINSCAKIIKVAFGRITNIPLKLTLEPIEVNNPESGKKQTVYVLNLRSDVTLKELADRARAQAKLFQIEMPDYAAAYQEQTNKIIDELWPDAKPSNPPSDAVTMKSAPSNEQVKEKAREEHRPAISEANQQVSEAKKGPAEKPKRDPSTIKNSTDLVKYCIQDWPNEFKSSKEVAKELGIDSMSMLTIKPSDAYKQIATVRQK